MAIKPNGRLCEIREQIIDDPVSGLTFQFAYVTDSTAPVRLRIYGDLPFGNREIVFDKNGNEAGSGTAVAGPCKATWLKEV
jgi:hypothetical protein